MDNTLPSRCYAITMILRVRRNFFEITTFPNKEKDYDALEQPGRRRISSALAREAEKEEAAGCSGAPAQAEKEAECRHAPEKEPTEGPDRHSPEEEAVEEAECPDSPEEEEEAVASSSEG